MTQQSGETQLSHLDESGQARMVNVSGKEVSARSARASGRVLLSAAAVAALRDGQVPKGDALAVARIAGIQGAKRTPDLDVVATRFHLRRPGQAKRDPGSITTAVCRRAGWSFQP